MNMWRMKTIRRVLNLSRKYKLWIMNTWIWFLIWTLIGCYAVYKYKFAPEKSTLIPPCSPNLSEGQKILVKYRGQLYDVTKFVARHPGGKKVLMDHNGLDVEKAMAMAEHSDNAYKILEKYLLK